MEVDNLREKLAQASDANTGISTHLQPASSYASNDDEGYRVELEKERQRVRVLESEKKTLLNQIQADQQAKIDKKKDKYELDARLRTAELEAQKSKEEREALEQQIADMRRTQNELLSKIRES